MKGKRIISLILALVMVVTMMPMSVFAQGTGTSSDPIIVYRNPEEDYAGDSLSASGITEALQVITKFNVRSATQTAWKNQIIAAASAAGYNTSGADDVYYYVQTMDLGDVSITEATWVGFMALNAGYWFGWSAAKSKTAGTDTEKTVTIVDSEGNNLNSDKDDLVVKVKGYVDLTWKVGSTSYADQVSLNYAINNAESDFNSTDTDYAAAVTAAEKYATDETAKTNGGIKYTFMGWDTDGDKDYDDVDKAYLATIIDVTNDEGALVANDVEGKTFAAVYDIEASEYTVTWKNDNGDVLETDTVEYGQTPTYDGETPVAQVTETGKTYTWTGWTPEVKAVEGDAEYTATYTAADKTYTVVWKNDNGEILETDTVTHGQTPTYDGATPEAKVTEAGKTYTWTGWTPEVKAADGAAEYTATYTTATKTYTVKFNTDGGSAVADATVGHGETIKANTATTKDGWRFAGWELEDGTAVDLSTYVVESDITLVAKWVQQVTVKFVVDGAEVAKYVIDINTALTSAPTDPSKTGYEFEGWLAEDNASQIDWFYIEDIATVKYGEDITYTARWLKIHTVTFNPNGATGGTMAPQTFLERQFPAPTLNMCEYTKTGYDFQGWATSADGEVVYADGAELPDADLTLYAVWKESPKADTVIVPTNNEVTVTYDEDYDLLALIAPVVKDEDGDVVEGAVVTVSLDDSNAGTRTATLSYAGGEKYNAAADVTVTVVINPAVAEIVVGSQTVKYGETVTDPFKTADGIGTIDFIAGIDAHDETYVVGSVMVTMPSDMLTLLALGAKTLGIDDLSDMTIDEAKKVIAAAEKMDGTIGDAAAKLMEYKDQLNKVISVMEKIQAELPMDTELKIGVVAELELPKNAGIYVAGSILADDNYAAASPEESMDAGYLIITPNGVKAELAWNQNDDNYIVTLSKLNGYDLGATATVVDSTVEGAQLDAVENHLDYLFIGVDNDGELVLDRVKGDSIEDVNKVLTQVGVYAQVVYIANWGNEMYYAAPIARPVIVSPDVANVTIHDANGYENYAQVFTYGETVDLTIKVDGVAAPVDGLKVKYIGTDTTVDGWYRTDAPTDAGVYTVVAIYTEKDAEGDISKAGAAVGAIIIEPADSEYALEDTQVCPDGNEHFANITDPLGQDEITIAIDRENNIAYVNLPADTKAHAERIISMLPAEVETEVKALLDKYADFDGDVQSSTVKAELNAILDKVIAVDMTAKAQAAAEQVIDKLVYEVENSEDVKALVAKIKTEVEALEAKVRNEIPDEYEEKLENYIRDIVTVTEDNVDIDIEKVKADLNAMIDEIEQEGGLPVAVAGVLYKVVEDLTTALENNTTVGEMTDKVKEIIAELKALEVSDAEAIVKSMLEAIAGKVDTQQVKALMGEVITKVENLGYVEYAKDLLSAMSEMYPVNVDVDSYVTAVETELDNLVATVKAKVQSGDLQKDDLDAIEAYVDSILTQMKGLVDKIPNGTIIFGHNPSEEGEYDCYAMNISANYKPEFVSNKLVIGHKPVTDAAVDPTCTGTGLTEGSHCELCGVTLVAQKTVNALGHDYDNGVQTTAPDCDDAGVMTYTCQRVGCGHSYTEAIDPNGHTEVTVDAVDPTCTTTGLTEGTECSVCHAVIVAQKTVSATGHAWGAWTVTIQPTYTTEGQMQRVCANDPSHVETRTIAKLVAPVVYPVVPPTAVYVTGLNTVDHVAYIVGYEDGTVNPTGTITRAEAATIYFRLMTDAFRNMYWSDSCSYADVADTAWYNVAISTLEAAGVIKDTATGGNFRPNEPITRAELAVMAAQFCTVTGNIPYASFTDVSVSHWAAKEIALVEYAGWIEGFNGKYRPDDNLTRAECVTIVNRMLQRGVEEENMLEGMVTFTDNADPDMWYYEAIQEAANSHTYTRTYLILEGEKFLGEKWLKLIEAPDWAALEKSWAAANKD